MGFLDSTMRSLAQNLVPQFGKTLTLIRDDGTYDSSSGSVTSQITTYSFSGVIEEPTGRYGETLVGGGEIRRGDLMLVAAAAEMPVTPDLESDEVRITDETGDEVDYQIVGVEPVYSGSRVAIWRMILRQ